MGISEWDSLRAIHFARSSFASFLVPPRYGQFVNGIPLELRQEKKRVCVFQFSVIILDKHAELLKTKKVNSSTINKVGF